MDAKMTNEERHELYRDQAAASPAAFGSKSPLTAVILSLLLTGAGHFYVGRAGRGLAWLFGGILLTLLTAFIAGPFVWIGAAIDAHYCAKRSA